jgi:long-subunit fatty acid transport protein
MKKNLLLLPILLLVSAMTIAQNGIRLIGFDAVTSGRGGTSTDFFDNPSLMMNNPAGLSFLKTSQADLSFSLLAPTVELKADAESIVANEYNNSTSSLQKSIFHISVSWILK